MPLSESMQHRPLPTEREAFAQLIPTRLRVGIISNEGKASLEDSICPTSSRLPAAFSGYRLFPPIINLYGNPSGVIDILTTFKLCGADKSDLLCIVEIHQGFTPRGPLHFRPGLYLRNGTSTDAPVLAAAGDDAREPLLMSTFSVKSFIMLPPLDIEVNPPDLVTEIMHATTSHGTVSFRFPIEVRPKMKCREEFEWRKTRERNADTQHSRFILTRLPPPSTASSSSPSPQEGSEMLAELVFRNVMSLNHLFLLELKGAACSGEMGKTNRADVGIVQKLRGK
ncbi:hypothetical protein MFIFM68171_05713 [Madurella fahalii]|uniref:Uncharacterized protein n=1 Tax=Madurella fahalii TaxID=1157608 RepID=A0ABQ0GCM8_9PEZI